MRVSWPVVVADVTGPIIGSYFLCFYNLPVGIRHRRLIDITNLPVNGASVGTYGGQIKLLAGSSRCYSMLQNFPDIIRPTGIPRKPRHSTVHHIRTTPGPPVTSRPRRLAPGRLRVAKTTPFKRQFFDTLHGLSHPGANATVKLVFQRFVWLGVGKDCCAWTRACTPR